MKEMCGAGVSRTDTIASWYQPFISQQTVDRTRPHYPAQLSEMLVENFVCWTSLGATQASSGNITVQTGVAQASKHAGILCASVREVARRENRTSLSIVASPPIL